jgi:hypothetical protein
MIARYRHLLQVTCIVNGILLTSVVIISVVAAENVGRRTM